MSGSRAAAGAVPSLLRRAVGYEIGMWRSLYRWVLRASPVRGGDAFPYAGVVTPALWGFIGVSAVEIPALHFLLPWEPVRTVALAVGIYGLLWMVGKLASLRVHPHTVDDQGLHVRYGATVGVLVPWAEIAAVRERRRSFEGVRAVRVGGSGPERALEIALSG